MKKQDFLNYCTETYGTAPDHPFEEDFVTAVFRHGGNRKWFAIAMRIPMGKLGLAGEGSIDVVNLKVSPEMLPSLWQEAGVFPAYHMNKKHWVTVALDGTASDETVVFLTGVSFDLTARKLRRNKTKTDGM